MVRKIVAGCLLSIAISSVGQAKDFTFAAQEFAPFNYKLDGVPTGGMVQVLDAVCEKLKHKCKIDFIPLARALKLAENEEVDGILSLAMTEERKAHFVTSPNLINATFSYMAPAKDNVPPMKDIQELSGYTAVATRGSAPFKMASSHAAKVKDFKVKEEVDNATIVRDLVRKGYGPKALGFSTEEVMKYIAQEQGAELVTVLPIEVKSLTVLYAKKRMDEKDMKMFDDAFNALKKDGTIKKILAKHKLVASE